MGKPADSSSLGSFAVVFGDEPVESRSLVGYVIVFVLYEVGKVLNRLGAVVFFPDAAPNCTKTFDGRAEVGRQEGGDLTPDSRRQFAAFARGGDSDLQWSVGMGGWKREGTQVWAVQDVDRDPFPPADI